MKIVIQNPNPKPTPTPKRKRGCRVAGGCWGGGAHRLLQLGIFTLRVDEVEDDVERARKDEGEEETEAGEVGVALRAACVRGRQRQRAGGEGGKGSASTFSQQQQ
jgi:hypothetical protein